MVYEEGYAMLTGEASQSSQISEQDLRGRIRSSPTSASEGTRRAVAAMGHQVFQNEKGEQETQAQGRGGCQFSSQPRPIRKGKGSKRTTVTVKVWVGCIPPCETPQGLLDDRWPVPCYHASVGLGVRRGRFTDL
ncbi:Hypothetical predicted protein [Marmota monax]|uniref:Uncharacterized protein n=1 Tax=Marmota monax TaxID=9995 RepID=A0A5E4BLR8_MARMO|nr:hypothetical protein GHT09_010178 [Marmota monax]VTJ69859.1 Hypothetical predicted protein [Marmota monax]